MLGDLDGHWATRVKAISKIDPLGRPFIDKSFMSRPVFFKATTPTLYLGSLRHSLFEHWFEQYWDDDNWIPYYWNKLEERGKLNFL